MIKLELAVIYGGPLDGQPVPVPAGTYQLTTGLQHLKRQEVWTPGTGSPITYHRAPRRTAAGHAIFTNLPEPKSRASQPA